MSTTPASTRRYGDPCPVADALGDVAGKWTPGVLGRLAHGPARFGALRLAAQGTHPKPPSAKVLAGELRKLTAADLVERLAPEARAPRYRLSERGRALIPLLDALGHWATSLPR